MLPEVVIFDIGGVFLRYTEILPKWFLEKHTAKEDDVRVFYILELEKLESGLISSEGFFERASEELGYQGNYENFREDFCKVFEFELNREVYDFFLELKACYGDIVEFWLLSNISEIHYNFLRKKWPGLFSNFWRVFLSFELKMIKPDPAIYGAILERGGKIPPQCVFIDDKAENGLTPKLIGMKFIHFQSLEKLDKELEKMGFE